MTTKFRVGLVGRTVSLYKEGSLEAGSSSLEPICNGDTPDELKAKAREALPSNDEFSVAEAAISNFVRNTNQ